jgi:ADP-ribose pyrophosphatase YjhB (NUDIX family)
MSAPRPRTESARSLVAAWTAIVAAAVSVVAWVVVAFIDVEGGAGIGVTLFLLGVVIVIMALKPFFPLAIVAGAAHMCIVLVLMALVNLFGWSPGDAHVPFTAIGIPYCGAIVPLAIAAWRRRPMRFPPWCCQACGYALFGLETPCCPECGRAFDVAAVAGSIEETGLRPSAPLALGDHPDVRRVFASVAILDDRRVLLVREAEPPGCWNLPGGGLERGEAPLDAARRELREETGLEVMPDELVGVYAGPRWVRFVFAARAAEGTPIAGAEIQSVHWVGLDELGDLEPLDHPPSTRPILADVAAGVRRPLDAVRWSGDYDR